MTAGADCNSSKQNERFACAISCIYGGIIGRSREGNPAHKAILLAAAVIGGIILLGITLSAIFIFVPAMG